jgi:hypothetical protein
MILLRSAYQPRDISGDLLTQTDLKEMLYLT